MEMTEDLTDKMNTQCLMMRNGDIPLCGFWNHGADCIVDVRVTNDQTESHQKWEPSKVPDTQEKEKKCKCLGSCPEHGHHFTPFVVSMDGPLGKRIQTFIRCFFSKLAGEWQKAHSSVHGHVNARMNLAIVRAAHLCFALELCPCFTDQLQMPTMERWSWSWPLLQPKPLQKEPNCTLTCPL